MSVIQEKEFQNQKIKLSTWSRILRYAMRHRMAIFAAVGAGAIVGALDFAMSLVGSWAIDTFIEGGTLEGFWKYLLIIGGIQVGFAVLTFVFVRACGIIEGHLYTDIRSELFRHLQTLSFSYYDKMPVGFILTRITTDIGRAVETLAWCFIDLGWGTVSIAVSLIGLFIINWRLATILIVSLPILLAVSIVFQKRILKHQRETRRINSMITSAFNEGIMGAQTTKTLVREGLNNKEFTGTTNDMRGASMRAALISALYMPSASLIIGLAVGAVTIMGGIDVTNSVISIGTLTLFVNIGMFMFEPIRQFTRIFAEFQSSQAAAERVIEVLDAHSDIVDSEEVTAKYGDMFNPKHENWEDISGSVEFRNVSFYYKKEEPVLKDFSLTIKAGENIALVGETGSGKSTIVNLICRFYEPQEGTILMDGVDIRERSQVWLQSRLGYVLQAPHLFSGSIKENIRYGRMDATDAEIEDAAKMVGAHEFITLLDRGYDTEVGEGGGLLSTGQKQLISFARAILADPKIFILDEATSSVDTESEMKIQKASEMLLRNRTSFIIAHRLSTIRGADRILVIENGSVIECGSHNELMQQRGHYYELYTNQFRSEKVDESLKVLE